MCLAKILLVSKDRRGAINSARRSLSIANGMSCRDNQLNWERTAFNFYFHVSNLFHNLFHGSVGIGVNKGTTGNNAGVTGSQVGTQNISQYGRVSATGVPFQVPPLPAHFVERPEVSNHLKQSLLSNAATCRLRNCQSYSI